MILLARPTRAALTVLPLHCLAERSCLHHRDSIIRNLSQSRQLTCCYCAMARKQKDLTAFFKPMDRPAKRAATEAAVLGIGEDKQQPHNRVLPIDCLKREGAESGSDPSWETAGKASPLQTTAANGLYSKLARGTSSEVPATPLDAQELLKHAEMSNAVARVRVEQASASGQAPRLQDLLVEDSWRSLLLPEFQKPYMRQLESFLAQEWASGQVFPPQPFIFRALNSVPVGAVRVVILGQDPYHNVGQAMGLSFSVPEGCARPSSLLNIYRELKDDVGFVIPPHGNLEKWTQQGVLLLNASLTVRAHQANSHSKKGWEQFTDAAIRALSTSRHGLVFLLWGRFAQQKASLIDTAKHHVLTAAHPSGLSAQKGFFGCRHFSKTNGLLEKEGLPPIEWKL